MVRGYDLRERRLGITIHLASGRSHESFTRVWRSTLTPIPAAIEQAADALRELHTINERQWRLEDRTRGGASDCEIASTKREIDASNRDRHRVIERVDQQLEASWASPTAGAPLTESIGSSLDRLSVAILRIAHAADASDSEREALAHQRDDLIAAIEKNCRDLVDGVRRAPDSRRFKRYVALADDDVDQPVRHHDDSLRRTIGQDLGDSRLRQGESLEL